MSRIYIKLVRYFIILIITTCFACMVLFFLTVGYPMTKDFHRLIRKHALHIGQMTSDLMELGVSLEQLDHFLSSTAESYESCILLYDTHLVKIAGSGEDKNLNVCITEKMMSSVREKGIFVQPSHFVKPLVYFLPVFTPEKEQYYLLMYKSFYKLKRSIAFTVGLVILCFLLILGIYPLSKGFTKPLIQLTDALKEISEGNFETTIESEDRNDELGDLLRVFRDMSKSVDTMIESRKALLADISHELRSPLARLNIAAELIKEETRSPSISGYIDNIEYEIRFMDDLLKQLSEYSTLNLPSVELNLEEFIAFDIIEDAFKRYQPLMEKKGITLVLTPCESKRRVQADYKKITQVLNNLLDNAMSACSPQGKITVGVVERKKYLVYFVTNTGPEIPEYLREKIFAPLFRTDPSRNRKTGGLGLGLAISRKIVEHHGGKIWCDCSRGITCFSFSLATE